MAGLVFDAVYNSEGVMRGVRESQRAFAELRSSAENEGRKIDAAFNRQIYEGSQSVNALTGKIIDQKKTVRSLTKDIDTLTEAYKKVSPDSVKGKDLFASLTNAKSMLKNKKEELLELQTQQAQVRLSVRMLKEEYSLYQKEGQNVVESNNNMAISFNRTLAAIGGTAMIKKFVSDVVRVRGEFQQLDVAFTTLLQSKDKSNALMQQMVQTAAKTPFNLTELATGAKQLVAYGFASEGVNDTLIRLGNIAAGLGLPLERLTYLYGTTMTQGRLYARDLMQFTTSGIPLLQGLADMFGVSTDKVNEMVTAGKIGFPEVQKVIESMTNQGGKFFNLMEEQSKTITGKISNLGDAWDEMLNKIGQSQEGVINNSIDGLKYLVENYETVGKILTGLVATYGAYKAATIAYYAITKTYGVYDIATKELQFAATMKNIVATKAMTVQQSLLNATILKNPYVLAAVALVSIASAMWAFHDSTTEAEKAQKRFNEKQEESKKIEEEHKQRIDSLVNSSRDIALSDLQRGQSLAELRKEYPKIFAQYDIETIKLADLLKLRRQISEEDTKRAGIKNKIEFSDVESEIKYYENLLKSLSGQQGIDGYVKKLKQLRLDRDAMLQEKGKGISEQFISGLKNIDVNNLNHYIAELERRIKGVGENGKIKLRLPIDAKGSLSEEAIYNTKDIRTLIETTKAVKKTRESAYNSEKKAASEWLSSYKKAYEDAEKAYNDFLKSKKVMSDADRDKELERLKGLRDTAKATYENKGGSVSSDNKQPKAVDTLRKQQEKLALLMDKQSLDRIRQQQDLENQAAQAEIDALSDGFEKIQAQRDLNNKKEIQALERQKEDYIRSIIQAEKEKFDAKEDVEKANNPKHVKRTFDASTVDTSKQSASWDKIIKNAETKQGLNEWEQREASMNEFLIKYGTFYQKKEAIDKKYQDAIEKETDLGRINILQKEWEESVANLNLDKLKKEINWEVVFGDMSKVAKKQLQEVKRQLTEFKKSAEFKNSTPEQIKVIEEALDKINSALVDKSGFFGGLGDSLADYKLKLEEAKKAQEEYDEALKTGNQALIEKATETRNTANANVTNSGTNVEKSGDKAVKNINAVSSAIVQLGKKDVSLTDIGNTVGALVDTLGKSGSMIGGIISAILSIIDAAGDIGTIQYGMNLVGNVTTKVTDAFARDTEAITGIDMSFMRGADYDDYNELKEQYETINSIWDELIDKKTEYLEIGTTEERKRTEGEILDLIGKQEQAYRNLGLERLNAGASAGSHSIGVRIKKGMSDEGWNQVKNALGEELYSQINDGRMEKLFSLSSEQLEKLKGSAPDFWAKLDDDVRMYLNDIIKCGEQTEETTKKAEELWAGMSFDSLVDNFKSALSDMDSSTEDFADDFQQYMINAMIDSFVNGEIFQKKLKDWHKKLAEYSESDKKITEEEKDSLKNDWDKMVQEGLDYRNNLFESMGFSNSSSTSQDSTNGGFQSMSQDTGSELNGRFTALQISNEEIKNSMLAMLTGVNLISTTTATNGITLLEIRNLAISSNSYLEDIAGFQKRIVNEFGSKLDNINSGIKQFNGKH